MQTVTANQAAYNKFTGLIDRYTFTPNAERICRSLIKLVKRTDGMLAEMMLGDLQDRLEKRSGANE